MSNLFQTLEAVAARGAAGLTSEAHESVTVTLRALQGPDGGFAGLDGRADPYYSFFAWLSLRALGSAYDCDRLCAYMAVHRRDANAMDACCANFLLAVEGREMQRPWLSRVVARMRGNTRGAYVAFLLTLTTGPMPRWAAWLTWRCQQRLFSRSAVERLPTPRLAAGFVLATLAGTNGANILSVLQARHCTPGGFASVPNVAPDLLATAVARFACYFGCPLWGGNDRERAGVSAGYTREDLSFVEACWMEDGLFGASPSALRGDSEHTFYGLLTLGTCRTT